MSKKRKKTIKDTSGITRRDMLKMGAGAAGAAAVLGPTMLTSRKASAFQDPPSMTTDGEKIAPVAEPVLCDLTPPASPPTTPFVDNLPIPSTAPRTKLNPRPTRKSNIDGGEAARAPHQRWEEFLPEVEYQLTARASTNRFHSDLLPSYIWGFNGVYPA